MAWNWRRRPPSALPPAESPSTRYSSHSSMFLLRAVAKLAGQAAAAEGALAIAEHFLGLAGGFAGLRGEEGLLQDCLGGLGIFFQVLAEELAKGGVDDAFDLGIVQAVFGLGLELRLGHADGDDGGQPFAKVLAAGDEVLEHVLFFAVVVERPRQGRAEAEDVGAAVGRVDVVDVGVEVFGVFVRVLQGDFDLTFLRLSALK